MGVIVLCIDSESLRHPQLIGLDDVSLEGLPWLSIFTNAQKARDFVRSSSCVDEVWVVSSDDVSAINLAAALKHDNPEHCVYLVTFKRTGSLISCMRAAGINGSLSRQGFSARFARERQRRSNAKIEASSSANTDSSHGAAHQNMPNDPQSFRCFDDEDDEARYTLKEPLSADVVAAYEQGARKAQTSEHAQDALENKASTTACAHKRVASAVSPQTGTQGSAQTRKQASQAAAQTTANANRQAVSQEDPQVSSHVVSQAHAQETDPSVIQAATQVVSQATEPPATQAVLQAEKQMRPQESEQTSSQVLPHVTINKTKAAPQSVSQAAKQTTSSGVSEEGQTFDRSSAANGTGGAETSDKSYGAPTTSGKQQSRGAAFVLSVVSGSGGVGRSTIAALSAFCAQRRGYRTLLLDCDLQFGDLHYFMGIDSPVRVEDILNDPLAIQSLDGQGDSPALVASLGHLEDADSLARMLPRVIDMLSEHFDVIVVNTGASWAEQHAVILECSSCALFLVDQRASSVRSCRRALDLCKRCGIATGSFAYAVNHCCRGALLTSVDVSCALQGVHVFELKDGGSIVEELLGAGMVFELVRERNDLCESIERMLDELLPIDRLANAATAGDAQRMNRRHSGGFSRKARRSARNRGREQTPAVQGGSYDMGKSRGMRNESVGTREMMSS